MRKKGRKPNIKDRFIGCKECLKCIISGILNFDIDMVQLHWMLFKHTAMGHCEVMDEEELKKWKKEHNSGV